MKLVYISDLHLRPTSPISRKEGYVDQQFKKLDFLIEYTNSTNGQLIIGGDLFDRASNHLTWFVNKVIGSFNELSTRVLIIPGNHDLVGHSLETLYVNTLQTINFTNSVCVVDVVYPFTVSYGTVVHLTPFSLTPPEPQPGCKNILVVHEPVYEDSVPFYMKDAVTVEQLEVKYPGYDLYLAGDIHIPCQKSKTLVSGSMMRMTSAQKDHKPRFYVIDTETLEVETVFFPIEEDVWKLDADVEQSVVFKEELQELASAMSERGEGLDYGKVLKELGAQYWEVFDKLLNEYQAQKENK